MSFETRAEGPRLAARAVEARDDAERAGVVQAERVPEPGMGGWRGRGKLERK